VKDIAYMLALYTNIGSEEGVACLPTSCRSCQEPRNNRDVTVQGPRKSGVRSLKFRCGFLFNKYICIFRPNRTNACFLYTIYCLWDVRPSSLVKIHLPPSSGWKNDIRK